jgi:hypothetical protein
MQNSNVIIKMQMNPSAKPNVVTIFAYRVKKGKRIFQDSQLYRRAGEYPEVISAQFKQMQAHMSRI